MCATASGEKLNRKFLEAARCSGESIGECRARIQLQERAADSAELAEVVDLQIKLDQIVLQISRIAAKHEGACRCPLCKSIQAQPGGQDGYEYWKRALTALQFGIETASAAVDGPLPLSPRVWKRRRNVG